MVKTRVKNIPGEGKKMLERALKELTDLEVQTGWFESAKYPDGTSVAYVATIQEFGYPGGGIAPRLGMRATIEAKKERWAKLLQDCVKKIMKGSLTGQQAMEKLGLESQGDFKKTISKVQEPPLSIVTLLLRKKKKGFKNGEQITGKDVGTAYAQAKQYNFVGPHTKGTKRLPSLAGVSRKPLIDTHLLFDSLLYLVRKK